MADSADRPPGNELFPSAAWRLLLPNPVPRSVAAFGDGPAATMARSMFRQAITSGEGPVDLAVADDLETSTITGLAASVTGGGTVYLQGRWSWSRRPGPLMEDLRRAGFSAINLYCLSIGADRWRTSWFVPVGRPAVIRYLLDQRRERVDPSRPLTLMAAAATILLNRMGTATSKRPWLLFRRRRPQLCVVAVKPGGEATAAATPGLAARCPQRDDGATADDPAVALRVGGTSTDQPMLLLFQGETGQPGAVIKVPDRAEELTGSRHELRVLRELAASPRPVGSVPRPVELAPVPGIVALGQTAVPGVAMTGVLGPNRFEDLAETVTDWLIELASATRKPVERGWYRSLVHSSVRVLDGSTSNSSPVLPSLGRIECILERFDPGAVVVTHCDLGPWNIHVDRSGRIGVIDWAGAVRDGPPGSDLVHFLTHLALGTARAYDPAVRHSTVEALGDVTTEMGAVADRCLGRYFDRLGIERPPDRELKVLTWTLAVKRQVPDDRPTTIYTDLLSGLLSGELDGS